MEWHCSEKIFGPRGLQLPSPGYMEMTQPFLEISWPILKRALMLEEATPVLDQDKVAPAKLLVEKKRNVNWGVN